MVAIDLKSRKEWQNQVRNMTIKESGRVKCSTDIKPRFPDSSREGCVV